MDVFTHWLVPYAGALIALGFWHRGRQGDKARAGWAALFGIAGAAPDLDGPLDAIAERVDALYWMQHRGVSHSLLGAPFFGLLVAGVLAWAARRWPRRFGLFAWRPAMAAAAVLGAWTHLLLDGLTYSGVPLWWPFAFGRVGYPLFSWIVPWLFPVGLLVAGLHLWGRLSRGGVARAGALILVALVVLAGLRISSRPTGEGESALVFPRASELEWTVLRPLPNGTWEAYLYRDGVRSGRAYFEPQVPPEAEGAVARAMGTYAYKGFLMGSFGPRVTRAEPLGNGTGWNVTIMDAAQRFDAIHAPRWAPTEEFERWGYVSFTVREDAIEVTHRGW